MPNKSYKGVAIVLGIIALVFAVLFFTSSRGEVGKDLEGVSEKFATCRENIAAWQVKFKMATVTADTYGELGDILKDCNNSVE